MKEFISEIKKGPLLNSFNEPDEVHQEFMAKANKVLKDNLEKLRLQKSENPETLQLVCDAIQAIFLVVFSKGKFSLIVRLPHNIIH